MDEILTCLLCAQIVERNFASIFVLNWTIKTWSPQYFSLSLLNNGTDSVDGIKIHTIFLSEGKKNCHKNIFHTLFPEPYFNPNKHFLSHRLSVAFSNCDMSFKYRVNSQNMV